MPIANIKSNTDIVSQQTLKKSGTSTMKIPSAVHTPAYKDHIEPDKNFIHQFNNVDNITKRSKNTEQTRSRAAANKMEISGDSNSTYRKQLGPNDQVKFEDQNASTQYLQNFESRSG